MYRDAAWPPLSDLLFIAEEPIRCFLFHRFLQGTIISRIHKQLNIYNKAWAVKLKPVACRALNCPTPLFRLLVALISLAANGLFLFSWLIKLHKSFLLLLLTDAVSYCVSPQDTAVEFHCQTGAADLDVAKATTSQTAE